MGYSDLKELFTDAKNLATGANDLQLKSVLLDIQGAVYDLQEENRDLKDKIKDLENQKILDSELVVDGHFLYKVNDRTNQAFCLKCWDSENKLIRAISIDEYGIEFKKCTRCDFTSDSFRKVEKSQI